MAINEVARDDGRIVDFNDKSRIERRFRPEQETVIDPVTKQSVVHDKLGPDGKPLYVWVAYEKVAIEPNAEGKRIHPVHGQETAFTYAWVIRGQGTEAEARAIAEKIAAS